MKAEQLHVKARGLSVAMLSRSSDTVDLPEPHHQQVPENHRRARTSADTGGKPQSWDPSFVRFTLSHSTRKAWIGSTFVARRAGSRQATSAVPASTAETAPNTNGSNGLTP